MWGPWEDKRKKKLMLKCRNCTYKEPTENTTPVYENHIVKQLKYVPLTNCASPSPEQLRLPPTAGNECPTHPTSTPSLL